MFSFFFRGTHPSKNANQTSSTIAIVSRINGRYITTIETKTFFLFGRHLYEEWKKGKDTQGGRHASSSKEASTSTFLHLFGGEKERESRSIHIVFRLMDFGYLCFVCNITISRSDPLLRPFCLAERLICTMEHILLVVGENIKGQFPTVDTKAAAALEVAQNDMTSITILVLCANV